MIAPDLDNAYLWTSLPRKYPYFSERISKIIKITWTETVESIEREFGLGTEVGYIVGIFGGAIVCFLLFSVYTCWRLISSLDTKEPSSSVFKIRLHKVPTVSGKKTPAMRSRHSSAADATVSKNKKNR